jgi:hypothetical protein
VPDLADAVVDAAGQPLTSRVGTILAVNPIQVDVGGTVLNPAVVGCVSSYLPRSGDTVVLVGQAVEGADSSGSTWLIVGACVNSGSGQYSHNGIQIVASAQSEGAGVFTNVTGLTFPFTKRRGGSLIHARLAGSSFASVVGGETEFTARILDSAGVQVTEQVLASFFYNLAGTHLSWAGFNDISVSVPAGSYTVQGRFRRSAGPGAISINDDDRLSLFFDEV